jgi:hypothetical protein
MMGSMSSYCLQFFARATFAHRQTLPTVNPRSPSLHLDQPPNQRRDHRNHNQNPPRKIRLALTSIKVGPEGRLKILSSLWSGEVRSDQRTVRLFANTKFGSTKRNFGCPATTGYCLVFSMR